MFAEFVSENLLLVGAFVVVFNLWLWTFVQGQVKGVSQVSALELPALQRSGKSVIIDASDADSYARAHIPDAINFALADINAQNSEIAKHKNKTTIVVCQTGSNSAKAARSLQGLGFEDLHILRGGMIAWTKENLPTSSVEQ